MADCKNSDNQSKCEPSNAETQKNIEANGHQGGKASYLSTLFHILAVSVGPIVFSLPLAFSMIGYASSMIGIAVVGFCYAYNLRLYLKCCQKLSESRKIENLTFADSVRFSLEDSPYHLEKIAPYAGQFMNVLTLLTWGGELSFNVVFICRNLQHVISYYTGTDPDIHLILLCCALPCTLISSLPKMKLSFLSIIAGTIDLLFLGVILVELYFNPNIRNVPHEAAPVDALQKLPSFLSVIFFTLNFSGIVLPLKSEMKNQEKFDSRFGLITVAVAIICIVDVTFGLLGYLRYGQSVNAMITLNLPPSDMFIQIMIGLYCLAIFFSYPVYFLVVFKTIWDAWISATIKKSENCDLIEIFLRICINMFLFLLMYIFPQISMFTNIGGLICAIINSLIVPSLVQILLLDEHKKSCVAFTIIRNIIFLIVGMVLLYFGLLQCFREISETTK
ncbi:hypothetical protein V9T40_012986 [Parthenolecanium corni]|uniref:Amino acid transporter transmembrane domain-containing protein n=1 Tax=Parthenolecanium corni TaxID=536013 RepID=A0AAN9TAJ3_9HEMI